MAQAVDYSWARPGGWRIAGAGYVGALRYLGPGNRGRDITSAELAELHGAGLAVGIVWETTATRAGDGYDAGQADARAAERYADALGWPADRPIYFAVDFDAPTPPLDEIGPYLHGWADTCRRPFGVYGEYDVIEAAALAGHAAFLWQCAAWSLDGSGSGGSIQGRRLSRYACLFQRVGYVLNDSCDANDILAPDWGGWHPDQQHEGDDDMTTLAVALTGKPDPTADELRDGLGRLVLFHVSGQARAESRGRGDAVGTGNNVPWTALDDLLSDGDALRLAVNTIAANRATIVEAIEGLQLGGDVDAGAIAEAVVDAFAARLAAAG